MIKKTKRKILPSILFVLFFISLFFLFFLFSTARAEDEEEPIAPNREVELVDKIYGFSKANIQDTDEVGGRPVSIAQNSKGHLYVVYSGQQEEVQVFDAKDKFLFKFGEKGEEEGSFSAYICGIAINSRDEVYVSDVLKKRILTFDSQGKFLFSFSSIQGLTKEDKKQNTAPSHIAIDSQDKVYISDTANGHIWVHDSRGNYLCCLGGPKQGLYLTAAHIRFDQQGRIFILEGLANRVQVCDSKGTLLFTIGKTGSRVGQFLRISGLAIDSKTRVYVTDIVLSVVQVFDSEGKFLGVIKYANDDKGGKHEFKGLSNIFIGQKDYIYLNELPFHRVTVIRDKN